MPKVYSSTSAEIRATTLPKAVMSSIGELIRAFAEIEDSLNIYIYDLAKTPEAAAIIMVGRTPMSQKNKIAEALSSLHDDKTIDLTKRLFLGPELAEAKLCRNAVAHGVLLGEWGDAPNYAFLTDKSLDAVSYYMRREVVSYDADTVRHHANYAAHWSKHISEVLGLGPLREKRLRQPLLPHRRGQKTNGGKGPSSLP